MNREYRANGIWLGALAAAGLLAGCGQEPPPTSVPEFMENPILLEATMVRCTQNRAEARYDAECMNAREAVDKLAAAEREARRAELEAQSERKRQALRRAQQAAAEARRRALEEQKRREEAQYLGQFEPLPDDKADDADRNGDDAGDPGTGNEQGPIAAEGSEDETSPAAAEPRPGDESDASAVPRASGESPREGTDIDAIRRELERRQQESDQPVGDQDR